MRFLKFMRDNYGLTFFFLAFAAGFAYYFYLHLKPYTQNAFLITNVSPVSALVPGQIVEIDVVNNQTVKKGDKILTIYREPYIWDYEAAKQAVEVARSKIKELEKQLAENQAEISKNEFVKANAWYQANMAMSLAQKKIVADKDAESLLRQAQAADATLEVSKAALALTAEQINTAKATLRQNEAVCQTKKINLEQTVVYAPDDGVVTNMFLTPGTYVSAGTFLFAFMKTDTWWIQANFKETELATVRPGQPASIRLWLYPGKTFRGVVDKINWGVNRQETSVTNALPVVEKENEWFLLPQRFPVQIRMLDTDPDFPFHVGASAYVTVETESLIFKQMLWQIQNFF